MDENSDICRKGGGEGAVVCRPQHIMISLLFLQSIIIIKLITREVELFS